MLTSPALAPVVSPPALSLRVVPVYTPPLPHLIAPEDNEPVTHRRYPLRLIPWLALSERGPHLIAATEKFSTDAEFPPTTHTAPLFSYATRFLVASEQHRQRKINSVIDKITGISLEYRHLVRRPNKDVWIRAFANNLVRLVKSVGTRMPAGTNTLFFVSKSGILRGRVVTYAQIVASLCPHNSKVHRVRYTGGSDKLNFPSITTTNYASLNTSKILINSNLSTPNARFLTLDIKDFYYNTPMTRF